MGVVNLAIGGDAGAPVLRVVADEVAHHAGLRGQSDGVGLGVRPDQAHAQSIRNRFRLLPLQVEDDLARSEEERVAGAAREKLDCGWRLPLMGRPRRHTASQDQ